jgi:hypothetical protein
VIQVCLGATTQNCEWVCRTWKTLIRPTGIPMKGKVLAKTPLLKAFVPGGQRGKTAASPSTERHWSVDKVSNPNLPDGNSKHPCFDDGHTLGMIPGPILRAAGDWWQWSSLTTPAVRWKWWSSTCMVKATQHRKPNVFPIMVAYLLLRCSHPPHELWHPRKVRPYEPNSFSPVLVFSLQCN